MDMFEFSRFFLKKIKLFVIYWRRIVFVKNHFPVSLADKIKANLFGGYLADQWALYNLDMHKRRQYLSEFDWYKSRYINEPFDEMLNNKVITTEALRQYIRVPQIYLVNGRGFTVEMPPPGDTLIRIVREKGDAMLKPLKKGKGNGVHRLTCSGVHLTIDGKSASESSIRRLVEAKRDWYLSETLHQHDYARALYDGTVNTIRLITMRNPDSGRIELFFAVQRVGTSHTIPVDNASQGGLVCRVDLETGRLSPGKRLHDRRDYEYHPESGIRLEDVFIPGWQEMKEEILRLANRFPYLHFVAWDVVKLPDGGNCVIEANTSSGVNIIQLWGGQRNGPLGAFYRRHGVIP